MPSFKDFSYELFVLSLLKYGKQFFTGQYKINQTHFHCLE